MSKYFEDYKLGETVTSGVHPDAVRGAIESHRFNPHRAPSIRATSPVPTSNSSSKHSNLVLIGANGLGKTSIVKNLAYEAALAGKSVLFRLASELIADLSCDSPLLRKRNLVYH